MSLNHCEECQDRLPSLLEDQLEESEARMVRLHLDACPECQQEYEWLKTAFQDLEVLGDLYARRAPEVDLVDAVLRGAEEIDRVASIPPLSVPRPRPWRWVFASLAGAAVATGIALLAYVALQRSNGTSDTPAPPRVAKAPETAPPLRQAAVRESLEASKARIAAERRMIREKVDEPAVETPEPIESTGPPELQITVKDILKERRDANTAPEALARLMKWASLTPDQARQVLQKPQAGDVAVIGAAQSLESPEAAAVLLRAVGHAPENPYLRFALAKEYEEGFEKGAWNDRNNWPSSGDGNPPNLPGWADLLGGPVEGSAAGGAADPAQDLRRQVETLRGLDPENALWLYWDAQQLLNVGDLTGALTALEQAVGLGRANTYTSLAAQYKEEALTANGMDPQVARTLTAFTAGTGEYNFLYDLSSDLLDFGRSYAQQDYVQEAQAIFEAVQRFGEQLEQSALFSFERLAGLDIQHEAAAELEGVYASQGSEEALGRLAAQMEDLSRDMANIRQFFDYLNRFLGSDTLDINQVADLILQNGDLSLLDYLLNPQP